MRRAVVFALIPFTLLTSGCVVFEDVYDERYEDECEEIRNMDEQRACYNRLEDHRYERRQNERALERSEGQSAG